MQLDRGTTLLSARGGYLAHQTEMVFTVVSNREVPKVERIVHGIDPACFMTVSRVSQVSGRGFSMGKEYKKSKTVKDE